MQDDRRIFTRDAQDEVSIVAPSPPHQTTPGLGIEHPVLGAEGRGAQEVQVNALLDRLRADARSSDFSSHTARLDGDGPSRKSRRPSRATCTYRAPRFSAPTGASLPLMPPGRPPPRVPFKPCWGSWLSAARTSSGRIIRCPHVEGKSHCRCGLCRRKRGGQRAKGVAPIFATTGVLHVVAPVTFAERGKVTDYGLLLDAALGTTLSWFRETFAVEKGELIGAVAVVHPTGEDLGVLKEHVDLTIALRAQRPDGTMRPLKWRTGSGSRSDTKRELQRRWAEALSTLFGRSIATDPRVFAKVHRDRHVIRRLLVRELRTFPSYKLPRLRSLGFLSSSKRGRARNGLGIFVKRLEPVTHLTDMSIAEVNDAVAQADRQDSERHERRMLRWKERVAARETRGRPPPPRPGFIRTIPAWLLVWQAHRIAGTTAVSPDYYVHLAKCTACARADGERADRERWAQRRSARHGKTRTLDDFTITVDLSKAFDGRALHCEPTVTEGNDLFR